MSLHELLFDIKFDFKIEDKKRAKNPFFLSSLLKMLRNVMYAKNRLHWKTRNHCHLTRRFKDPAHSNCNLNYKYLHCVSVIFHNLSGYNAHFIIKKIATVYEGQVDLLPITKEKYISQYISQKMLKISKMKK